MKVSTLDRPHSSFLSIEKDLEIITNKMLDNPRLKRLLYYTTPNALSQPSLDEDQSLEVFKKNIKIVPKLYIDNSVLNYIIVGFDNFFTNDTNPEFRDNTISFDIICHFDQWKLDKSFQLRPYRIAAEIDTMLNNQKLTGIGLLQFLGASTLILNDEFAGVTLTYAAIHGVEDKKPMSNPIDWDNYKKEY